MTTKLESDYLSTSRNDESDGEELDSVNSHNQERVCKPKNVVNLIKKLQSSGALIREPVKKEYYCYTCAESFPTWRTLETHLIHHVSLPSVVLDKLPSDDEDVSPFGDENWSDEEETPDPPKPLAKNTPQKMDISQILKKTGISIKKSGETEESSDSALNKLSGLGFTIKKNTTPIKKEPDSEKQNTQDVMQKLGKLGGIKLKLKSDGNNSNTFKVINGLKDFKTSDDEDEGSGNEDGKGDDEDFDDDNDKSGEHEQSGGENDSADERNMIVNRKNSESDDSDKMVGMKIANSLKTLQGKSIVLKTEPTKQPVASKINIVAAKPGRPAVKQTPKRGTNRPMGNRDISQQHPQSSPQDSKESSPTQSLASTPERRQSSTENVVVKKEIETNEPVSSDLPLFSSQIKSERASPPPNDSMSTPIIAKVKSEPVAPISAQFNQPLFSSQTSTTPSTAPITPLLPVTKTENTMNMGMTIIEINGDSNDEDDDCCVVSATPAPDVKPIIPKTENPVPSYSTSTYPSSQPSYSTNSVLTTPSRMPSALSMEKQHNFNWNAPDSKPPIDMLEKSTDDIFESLLSSATKKENLSLSDASEYISLDTLGPQHSCDVCNTRFTDISLLEDHKRMTGHSNSLVAASSSTLMPYTSSSNILSSLLPVKQLADQVGKLSAIGSGGPGFTHQQNVMINIQAYPGGGGVMVPPQSYNSYNPGQNMPPAYPQTSNNMYSTGQPGMQGQYPGQNYMGQQGYGQYQSPMSKPGGYPGTMPGSYPPTSSPYSTASPLQSMQQTVYGQSPTGLMNSQVGHMGPPLNPANPYDSISSPGAMKSPTNNSVRIQNVQTFPPGQLGAPGQNMVSSSEMPPPQTTAPGQTMGGQMPAPNQIRMAAGANITGTRPRMPNIRGLKPFVRPGIQVHGQVRGSKPGPRMPIKRPGGMATGPGQKRRPDMLLPGKHDNEDCQVMAMQKQREGLPLIQSIQGAKDKISLGSQISVTKKTVNKEANAMANVLASRGISVKQKQKSRSPTPERPIPHIPNLGAGVSIKHTSKSSNFSIPEAKVGASMTSCKICKKMFMNPSSLSVHMASAHANVKLPAFKCDECPASYPKSLQLQHHKRVFHNVNGPNRELGLPVVDLSQEDNLKRLNSLGIYSFIPLANREQASGCFGIPVISVHKAQNGLTNSLQALGADGLLSLGPLKPLPNS